MIRKIVLRGIESGYLMDGETNPIVEGKPDQRLKAGNSCSIPAGVMHDAKMHDAKMHGDNVHGDKGAKVIAVYVVNKTKPLASPAP